MGLCLAEACYPFKVTVEKGIPLMAPYWETLDALLQLLQATLKWMSQRYPASSSKPTSGLLSQVLTRHDQPLPLY